MRPSMWALQRPATTGNKATAAREARSGDGSDRPVTPCRRRRRQRDGNGEGAPVPDGPPVMDGDPVPVGGVPACSPTTKRP